MATLKFFAAIMLLWTLREVIVGSLVWRRRRRIRQSIRVECTQRHFAEARNEIMRLARTGKVDMNSVTFGSLYSINTMIMRRPDQYQEISTWLMAMFLNPDRPERNELLVEESRHWTGEIKEVVRLTAAAMDYIILEYSRLFRILYWIERQGNPGATVVGMLRKFARGIDESRSAKDPIVSGIRSTQRKMSNLCTA